MAYAAGQTIAGRYKIVRHLGEGGMGSVYLVEDMELHSTLRALKLLHSHVAKELRHVERFRQEMKLSCELSHDNIIRFFEFGETPEGQYFLTMEYFEGQNLGDILDADESGQGLPFEEVLPILYYMAGALHHIHSKNIIHRDVKPSNILIGADGTVKLTDLGIAKSLMATNKLTRTNEMVGTSAYMSPEQFTSSPVDHRTDIYSFGITAFELVTGKQPFEDENYVRQMAMHLSEPIPKISELVKGSKIPSWFQRFVETCSAKKVGERYQSMSEVALELYQQLTKQGIEVKSFSKLIDQSTVTGATRGKRGPLTKVLVAVKRGWDKLSPRFQNGLIAIVIGIVHSFLMTPIAGYSCSGRLGEAINLTVMDTWFNWRGRIEPPKDIVIIAIDEKSHEELGVSMRDAWPRRLLAELLEKLAEFKPRRVFLDLNIQQLGVPEEDARLAKSISLSPTYLAENLRIQSKVGLDGKIIWTEDRIQSQDLFLKEAVASFNADVTTGLITGQGSDIVRHFSIVPKYPSLAQALLGKEIQNYKLPSGRDYINYYGPPNSVISVPIYRVIKNSEIAKSDFEGKNIFIGRQLFLPYTSAQTDTFLTPFKRYTAGVEIHATVAGNILESKFIARPPPVLEMVLSFVVSIAVAFVILGVHPRWGIYVCLLLAVLAVSISYIMLGHGSCVASSALGVTAILAYLVGLLRLSLEMFFIEKILGK